VTRRCARTITGLGVLIGTLAVIRARRRVRPDSGAKSVKACSQVDSRSECVPHSRVNSPKHQSRHVLGWRLLSLFFISVSFIAIVAIFYRPRFFLTSAPYVFTGRFVRAQISLLVPFILSVYVVIRRDVATPRYSDAMIKAVAFAISVILFMFIIFVTIRTVNSSGDPILLLETAGFSLCAIGIALLVPVAWFRGWDLTEPLALGVMAVALGALCLPGLRFVTQAVYFPTVSGGAALFAAGPANQGISLDVSVIPPVPSGRNPVSPLGNSTTEDFDIENPGNQPVRWAVLIVGDARISDFEDQLTPGIRYRKLSASTAPALARPVSSDWVLAFFTPPPDQLFYGIVNSKSSAQFGGSTSGQFADTAFSRSAVTLPMYAQGDIRQFSRQAAILNALGKVKPILRSSKYFTLYVEGGALDSFQTVSEADPTLSDPSQPEWTSHSFIQAQYSMVDQRSADTATNVLYVFAVLLGVAGAGVFAALQSTIHVVLSRGGSESPS
jgi:hypothetical protein